MEERYRAIKAGEIDRLSEPFGVRKKEFWPLWQTEDVLTGKLIQQLSHEPDGAIFQPTEDVSSVIHSADFDSSLMRFIVSNLYHFRDTLADGVTMY